MDQTIEILVVDDEQEMLVSYEKILSRAGFKIRTTTSPSKSLELMKEEQNYTLAIIDLHMPEMDGMKLLASIKKDHPYLPVIMVTGYGTLEKGIEAVKSGAFDFIEKPFSSKKLLDSIEQALRQISYVKKEFDEIEVFDNIIGRSDEMKKIFTLIQKVAYGNANVLITGGSGVGKELVARSIHKHSLRRNMPFIPINCGALPFSLFESELFGYEKGAFTGAFQAKPGLIEIANGGTLFLDEVCEMPQDLQVKLLRVLEERKIRRIGAKEEISVDIRILTATNRNIEEAIAKQLLREDFFFRINTIHIHIPPLKERTADISLLIQHFLDDLNEKYDRSITGIEDHAVEVMEKYEWPGNVRELQNVIERTYYLANPPTILATDLPGFVNSNNNRKTTKEWENLPYKEAKDRIMEQFEQNYLDYQLKKFDWNISRTAAECGMDRRTIHRLINKFNLKNNNLGEK
jgi:DNA-binding NtrC family response regulator